MYNEKKLFLQLNSNAALILKNFKVSDCFSSTIISVKNSNEVTVIDFLMDGGSDHNYVQNQDPFYSDYFNAFNYSQFTAAVFEATNVRHINFNAWKSPEPPF